MPKKGFGAQTKLILLENDIQEYYLTILKEEKNFSPDALGALAAWYFFFFFSNLFFVSLQNNLDGTEEKLCDKSAFETIKAAFLECPDHLLESLLQSLLTITEVSEKIPKLYSGERTTNSLVSILRNKLDHGDARTRMLSLSIFSVLKQNSENPALFLKQTHVYKVVEFMANQDSSNVVKQKAIDLLKDSLHK